MPRFTVPAVLVAALLAIFPPVALGAGATPRTDDVPAIEGKCRYAVAAIGDSITDARIGGGRYMTFLQERCPKSRFDPYGVGGQQTRHMRWRFTQDVFGDALPAWSPKKPAYTHVIVLGGVNDLSGGVVDEARLDKIRDNLSFMYETGKKRGVSVVAMTIPPWGGFHPHDAAFTTEINGWILDQAKNGAVAAAVDVHPLLVCENGQLCPKYRRVPKDVVHWNDAGHEVVAKALFEQVFANCE